MNYIDTAESYAYHHCEELVGQAISGFERSRLFISSKVSGVHTRPDDILRAVRASLKRLHTDYLDMYLIHEPCPTIPIQEALQTMNELKDRGVIRNIGVSNFTAERLLDACKHAKISMCQAHYNLIYREPERRGLLEYCQAQGIFFGAWRPLEFGELAKMVPAIEPLCRKYGKTPAQIAINWLASQDNVVTFSKMSGQAHLSENIGAIGWVMDKEDIELLRREYLGQKHYKIECH